MAIDTALDTALPREVARALYTTESGLAQMRYRGTGPKFCKVGQRILYRWSDVQAYLAEVLNISEERVVHLAKIGVLRSRGPLVQPAKVLGVSA